MKIFWSILEEIDSDDEDSAFEDEDPDLESEDIYFDSAQTIESFLSKLKFRDYLPFFVKNGSVKNITYKYVSTVSLKYEKNLKNLKK